MKYLLLLIISACQTIPVINKPDPETIYKREMTIRINDGEKQEGMALAQDANIYKIEVWTPGALDLFKFTTCHREYSKEKAGDEAIVKKWWGSKRIKYTHYVSFEYQPNQIEQSTYCPIHLRAYSELDGKHSWGFIDFVNDLDTLPATLECNGDKQIYNGVSICQSKKFLWQKIDFENTVIFDEQACPYIRSKDQKKHIIEMPDGHNICVFMDVETKETHRLTLFGYRDILVKK